MLLVLYAPACCVLVAAGTSTCASLALSPAITTAWLGVAGVTYALAGIPANPITMLVPPVIASLPVAFLLSRHRPMPPMLGRGLTPRAALLYVAAGTVACLFVFVSRDSLMGGFIMQWDNDTHLGVIRAFADSQSMSSLRASSYLTAADATASPFGGTAAIAGFYPAAFHGLCALVVLGAGISAPAAINAFVTVVGSVVFPLAMALCTSEVFEGDRVALLSGAILCCLFPAMPYATTVFGPLYPNIFAFALLPLGVALVFSFMNDRRRAGAPGIAALFVTVVSLVFTHPNAVFALGVLTVPSLAAYAAREQRRRGRPRAQAWGAGAGILAAAVTAWVALFNAPFLHDIVSNCWGTYESVEGALCEQVLLITSSYLHELGGGQPLLFALAAIGAICDLVRRGRPGLVASYVALQAMCVVSASTEGVVRQLVTGFWYTDSNRLAALLAIPAIMFASEGVSGICQATQRLLGKPSKRPGLRAAARAVPALVAIALVAAEAVAPLPHSGTLGRLRHDAKAAYGRWNSLNSEETRGALRDIKEIVGDDTVANSTYDGSLYAYGTNGIRTLYRTNDALGDPGDPRDTAGAQLVRTRLNQIATDASVRAEARRRGIRWVLQMDVTGGSQQADVSYRPEDWTGIESIDEDTPGFQLAYANGSMRLYRVVE